MITYKEFVTEKVTKTELNKVEVFADKLFAKIGIDVEFSRHFLDRLNDARNGKEINTAELVSLFRKLYKKHGKALSKLPPDFQALINDINSDINIPFALNWDDRNGEMDLVAKTVMRKKNFKSSNDRYVV